MSTRYSEDVVLITGGTGARGSSHARCGRRAEDALVVVASRRDDAGEARAGA